MDLLLSIVIFLFLVITVVILFKNYSIKFKIAFVISYLVVCIFIISFGHSNLNYRMQTENQLNNLRANTVLSYNSDPNAREEIMKENKNELEVQFLSIKSLDDNEMNRIKESNVIINDKHYVVRSIYHSTPLAWSPFEVWTLNRIEIKK